MQEHFPAGAWQATIPNNEARLLEKVGAGNAGAFSGVPEGA